MFYECESIVLFCKHLNELETLKETSISFSAARIAGDYRVVYNIVGLKIT